MLLVTHDRALLDAVSGRVLAIEDGRLVAYAGGWAEYLRRDEEAEAPPAEAEDRQAEAGAPAPGAKPPTPTPLELVEREIARGEERVAELERQLAEDWTNVDLVAAHRRARDDLEALLARWEALFEESPGLTRSTRPSPCRSGQPMFGHVRFLRPRGLPTSRPYAIEPIGEIVTCL